MSQSSSELETLLERGYQHGFVTDIESDTVPPGLDEDVVRLISRKKGEPEFLTAWRLKALRHWLTMREPHWAHVKYAPINYQGISFGIASTPPLKLNILDCVIAPPDNSGIMNHIEVRVNQNEIDVYATDAGVVASPTTLRKIASIINANLTFTRGLVCLEERSL